MSMTATVWPRFSRLRARRRPDPAAAHDHDVHAASLVTASAARARVGPADAAVLTARRSAAGSGATRPTSITTWSTLSDIGKRLLVGRKLRSAQLGETLLPKRIALPVFASDALSSVAYAPDEILLTLSLGRAGRVRVLLEDRARWSPS